MKQVIPCYIFCNNNITASYSDVWMWWLDLLQFAWSHKTSWPVPLKTHKHLLRRQAWTIVQTQVIVDLNMREDSWLGRYFGVVHIKIQETNPTLFGFDTRETIQRHPNFIISGELYSLIFWLLKVSKAISISYFACYECFRISYFWCVSVLQ